MLLYLMLARRSQQRSTVNLLYKWLTSFDEGCNVLIKGPGKEGVASRTEGGEQSRGLGNTHREVHLAQLDSPAICVHVCVAV